MSLIPKEILLSHLSRAEMASDVTLPIDFFRDLLYQAMPKEWLGLTDEQIEAGRAKTFSINNPYCPCDSKTMRKAVRWAEAKLKEKNT